ncbi:hypothetical protein RIN58_07800 [Siccibacter colletis]|uniref:hypothetical protein n=1 Tax=Siccibacter colletis TaxID=1505757 RepID=UPI0028BE6671|nr:hypothetical protein [Siccibacter colletis]WNN49989.1 hypothetical protein RIN58_07800 [Siccibacter colletis]
MKRHFPADTFLNRKTRKINLISFLIAANPAAYSPFCHPAVFPEIAQTGQNQIDSDDQYILSRQAIGCNWPKNGCAFSHETEATKTVMD